MYYALVYNIIAFYSWDNGGYNGGINRDYSSLFVMY